MSTSVQNKAKHTSNTYTYSTVKQTADECTDQMQNSFGTVLPSNYVTHLIPLRNTEIYHISLHIIVEHYQSPKNCLLSTE